MVSVDLVTCSLMSGSGLVTHSWKVELSDGTSREFDNDSDALVWALKMTKKPQHPDVNAKFAAIVNSFAAEVQLSS